MKTPTSKPKMLKKPEPSPRKRKLKNQPSNRQDDALYRCAAAVEKDQALGREMEAWDATLSDGLQ